MKHQKNPLAGKITWTKEYMVIRQGVKFAGQLIPKVTPREWFYLFIYGNLESFMKSHPKETQEKIKTGWIGSRATRWRIKKSLEKKGYL